MKYTKKFIVFLISFISILSISQYSHVYGQTTDNEITKNALEAVGNNISNRDNSTESAGKDELKSANDKMTDETDFDSPLSYLEKLKNNATKKITDPEELQQTMSAFDNLTNVVKQLVGPEFTGEFSNYTSEKYKVQFEYPSSWEVTEKSSRFDEGGDLTIRSGKIGGEIFEIHYSDDLVSGFGSSDLEEATINSLSDGKRSLIGFDVRVIEEPHFITIDNHKAGTFVTLATEKYDEFPTKIASQVWIVFDGSQGYLISFMDTPKTFDSPENTEIRNHFIQSIKFLGDSSTTQTTKSRFD
jgi:hypothetical protein